MRNKVFTCILVAFLIFVMIAAPVKRILTVNGLIEKDNVGNDIKVEKEYGDNVLGAPFWNGIEEAKRELTDIYTNYIPFYVDITSAAKTFTQNINAPISSFLMDFGNKHTAIDESGFAPLIEATYLDANSQNRFYQIDAQTTEDGEKMSFYIRVPPITLNDAISNVDIMLNKINTFASMSPDVNWYVYAVPGFEDTVFCDTVLPSESKKKAFDKFFNGLSKKIKSGYIEINSIEDQYNKFFHTDHHWNVYGYTEAYKSIVGMFKENYKDIKLIKPEIVMFDKVEYRGSNARTVGRFELFDKFGVATYKLPAHTTVIEDGVSYNFKIPKETNMKNYLAGNHNTERAYSHYMAFQPILEQVTYPKNKTGRNLLIIGDSFSPPITEPLAAYFDETYIRYVDTNPSLEEVELAKYIDENKITDVLFLEKSCRLMYDCFGDALYNTK